jgi:hypothetical protein
VNTNSYIHDPNAVLDYTVDWSDWLVAGDTIISRVVTAPAGITKNSDSFTTTTVTAWMTGGTVGSRYEIIYHVTTANGRQDDRTLTLNVQQR